MALLAPRLSVLTLGVSDLERSVAFYTTLGFTTNRKPDEDVAFFFLQTMVLSLYPSEALAADAGVVEAGNGFRRFSIAYNAESPEAVDRIFAGIEAAGGSIVKTPQKVFWGGYSGYFADPDGFLWEVAHNPFWTLDDRGVPRPNA